MKNSKLEYLIVWITFLMIVLSGCMSKNSEEIRDQKVGLQPDGSIFVPSNQFLRPAGFQVSLPGRPVDLVLTPDRRFLIVKNRLDLDLIRLTDRTVIQSLPYTQSGASFTGLALSPENGRASWREIL